MSHTLFRYTSRTHLRDKSVSSSHLLLVLRCEASHFALGRARGRAGVRGGLGGQNQGVFERDGDQGGHHQNTHQAAGRMK